MRSDLEIAQHTELKPITAIADELGILDEELFPYGKYRAKVDLGILERLADRPRGKYVVVTAMTPTPLGEGKTLTTVGLGQALNTIGKKGIICIRQPSMGPVFGIKGGAAGGGHSQVVPMEQINLHLTGDIHAVEIAHNLLAAMIDNHLHQGNPLDISPHEVEWRRVVDVSDRALRNVIVGLGGRVNGVPRETGFDITVASELMAILALANNLGDMRKKLGQIVIGPNRGGEPVTAEDLKGAGAMAVVLKDALMPTLMQTIEHTPAFIHTGPFANIAHGNSSILADRIGLALGDFVVTEAGFGADMGFEKFANIKCRFSGLKPDAVVLVATVRALKVHSGRFTVKPGKPLDDALVQEDLDAIRSGACNLAKHIENVRAFGCDVVVAINRFPTDTTNELKLAQKLALEAGAAAAVVSEVHAKGGPGGAELAQKVAEVAEKPNDFRLLYPDDVSIDEKIQIVAKTLYGADGVTYEPQARKQLGWLNTHGFSDLPICMAKTPLSLSHDATLKGRPSDFTVPIREIRASIGAGFLVPICGNIMRMPGLPATPGAEKIDIDEKGRITGLF